VSSARREGSEREKEACSQGRRVEEGGREGGSGREEFERQRSRRCDQIG